MIDQNKGMDAAAQLVVRGLATEEEAKKYAVMVQQGISYAQLMVTELGKEMGVRFLAEEYVQHRELADQKLPSGFDNLSVPEVLLLEDADEEPWHEKGYTRLPGEAKFRQEAAEPWHPSLRKKYPPDPKVSAWFNEHPEYFNVAMKILGIVYQEDSRGKKGQVLR